MPIPVRISNNRLNSYGFRVLTDGMDISQFRRNPVLLHMHTRSVVVGHMENVRKEGDEVLGDIIFDEVTELSRQLKAQFEAGSLRMVSAGLEPLEWSEDRAMLVEGQTRATVTKSRLIEVSVVDIGSNDDAIALFHNGETINLGAGGLCPLPLISINPNTTLMNENELAQLLGLAEGSTMEACRTRLTELMAQAGSADELRQENERLRLAAIERIVNDAVSSNRITAASREHFITLGKEIGPDKLSTTIQAVVPQSRLSTVIGREDGFNEKRTWDELDRADCLIQLKEEHPEVFAEKFREKFGRDLE